MSHKRKASESHSQPLSPTSAPKRARLAPPHHPAPNARVDRLSPLSDELLLRILSCLSTTQLVSLSPVSHRFHRLAGDSQLWRQLYQARFLRPSIAQRAGRQAAAKVAQYSSARREEENRGAPMDWKILYKVRHNWSRGKCTMEELPLGLGWPLDDEHEDSDNENGKSEDGGDDDRRRGKGRGTLIRFSDGMVVTADMALGLRVWDLKTKSLVGSVNSLESGEDDGAEAEEKPAVPTCLAIDDQRNCLHIAIGFADGSLGVWDYDIKSRQLTPRYRHQTRSSNGNHNNSRLADAALLYPYLLTATDDSSILLYTFDTINDVTGPHLLSSLRSHVSRSPLALSIRKLAGKAVASIAYAFATLHGGWSVGLQDLHLPLAPSAGDELGKVSPTSRLAHAHTVALSDGPISLCYSHPYLLAVLPDNTLVLHVCVSNPAALTISPGIRLWGHTSGIGDAEITARGKAVSVSTRGEEIRVWQLEGRGAGGRSSVRVSPRNELGLGGKDAEMESRNWVGFDDEMVIVLKESWGREKRLMVYDFT